MFLFICFAVIWLPVRINALSCYCQSFDGLSDLSTAWVGQENSCGATDWSSDWIFNPGNPGDPLVRGDDWFEVNRVAGDPPRPFASTSLVLRGPNDTVTEISRRFLIPATTGVPFYLNVLLGPVGVSDQITMTDEFLVDVRDLYTLEWTAVQSLRWAGENLQTTARFGPFPPGPIGAVRELELRLGAVVGGPGKFYAVSAVSVDWDRPCPSSSLQLATVRDPNHDWCVLGLERKYSFSGGEFPSSISFAQTSFSASEQEQNATRIPGVLSLRDIEVKPFLTWPYVERTNLNRSFSVSFRVLRRGAGSTSRPKRRYFVLNKLFLYYFKSPSDSAPLGFLDLQTTAVKALAPQAKRGGGVINSLRGRSASVPASMDDTGPLEFLLIAVNGSWVLRSADGSDETTRAWQEAIQTVSQRRLLKGMGLGRDSFSADTHEQCHATNKSSGAPSGLAVSGTSELRTAWRRELDRLLELPENRVCADCNSSSPTWASINLGAHRHLGVHLSKVRSVELDDWTGISLVPFAGNSNLNRVLEATLSGSAKPTVASSGSQRLDFIRDKYVERRYVVAEAEAEESSARPRASSASSSGSQPPPPPPPDESDDDDGSGDDQKKGSNGGPVVSDNGGGVASSKQSPLERNKELVRKVLVAIIGDLDTLLAAVQAIASTDDAIALGNVVKEIGPNMVVLSNVFSVSLGPPLSGSASTSTGPAAEADRVNRARSVLEHKTRSFLQVLGSDTAKRSLQSIESQEDLLVVLQPIYSIRRSLQKLSNHI